MSAFTIYTLLIQYLFNDSHHPDYKAWKVKAMMNNELGRMRKLLFSGRLLEIHIKSGRI
jgi:hypothetical protein